MKSHSNLVNIGEGFGIGRSDHLFTEVATHGRHGHVISHGKSTVDQIENV